MSLDENRAEVIKYWWEDANKSIDSARREIDAGNYRYAINRLYYALFYSVSAALMERGFAFKKHSGVKNALHNEFVKTGIIDKELGKLYDRLFEDRHEGDYIAFTEFNKEYTENLHAMCSQFLAVISKFITSI